MSDETLTTERPYRARTVRPPQWGLCIAWCLDEPHRLGETLVLAGEREVFGRGDGDGSERRMLPWRIRPGASAPTTPLVTRRISRRQLEVRSTAGGLQLSNLGKTALRRGGHVVGQCTLRPGEAVELDSALVLVAVRRVVEPAPLERPFPAFPFGEQDAFGMVGESEAAWQLRGTLAAVAARPGHVLLLGPSGAGKELAVGALHELSGRSPLIARNAATIPESLAAAELFGNLRDYPNPGMADRAGLVGQADRGTLLLDEIGELPIPVQAGLLRVLDAGEHQRLGEARPRRVDVRVVGATHRPLASLKHDLVARFRHQIRVAGLDERPEDVPLLTRHLLALARQQDTTLERFFDADQPRLTPEFVQHLIARTWSTHARELDALLWQGLRDPCRDHLHAQLPQVPPQAERIDPAELSVEEIEEALRACGGVVSQAWRRLGLNSRDQLRRLMRKHKIPAR